MATVPVLDIGSSHVICLVAETTDLDTLRIAAVGSALSVGVKKGVIVDPHRAAEAVGSAIRQAESKVGGEIDDLHVSINGGQLSGTTGQGFVPIHPRGRSITREDVLQVLSHSRQLPVPAGRELLHAMPREFLVDSQPGIHSAIGMPASRLEVVTYVLTAESSAIDAMNQAVSLAGKRVEQFVAGPLASGMGVLSKQEIEAGSICVDIGGGKTDVCVFSNGALAFSATIPIGGQLVTSDVAHLVKTSLETAETLKLASGAALARTVLDQDSVEVMQLGQVQARPMQRRVLCEIIESRMREIATCVKSALDASSQLKGLPSTLVLTGGGSLMPNTGDLFTEVLGGVNVRQGRPDLVLPPMAAAAPPAASFAGAVGLARFAADSYEDELAPASGADWMAKMRSLWSMFGAKT